MDTEQLHSERKLLTEALRDSRRISAIKAVRAMTGAGLLESKMVVDALFDVVMLADKPAGPMPYEPSETLDQSAHYVVCYRSGGEDYVHNFRDDYDNRDQAMELARSKMEYVSDSGDIAVAKVVAITKRTLVTL